MRVLRLRGRSRGGGGFRCSRSCITGGARAARRTSTPIAVVPTVGEGCLPHRIAVGARHQLGQERRRGRAARPLTWKGRDHAGDVAPDRRGGRGRRHGQAALPAGGPTVPGRRRADALRALVSTRRLRRLLNQRDGRDTRGLRSPQSGRHEVRAPFVTALRASSGHGAAALRASSGHGQRRGRRGARSPRGRRRPGSAGAVWPLHMTTMAVSRSGEIVERRDVSAEPAVVAE